MSSSVLDVNFNQNYIFAYELHGSAINEETKAIIDELPDLSSVQSNGEQQNSNNST
jgi:hypothetical protein